MRSTPEDEDELAQLAELKPEPWMTPFLDLNPPYVHWGPGEDYMRIGGGGWDSSDGECAWKDFLSGIGKRLDDWNEIVHFYFEITREAKNCGACRMTGLNPASREIQQTFYDHPPEPANFEDLVKANRSSGFTGRRWKDKITQDEVDALIAAGRLRRWDSASKAWVSVPWTAEEVNAANTSPVTLIRDGHDMLMHDGINQMILVETRCKRLGVWGYCEKCHGHGYIHTAPGGQLNLVVWMLQPRKGASRGVRIVKLTKPEAAEAIALLKRAAERNAMRFAKVTVL